MKYTWLAVLWIGMVGCEKPKPAVTEVKVEQEEPIAVRKLREKASQRGLKWSLFENGDGYLSYATDG